MARQMDEQIIFESLKRLLGSAPQAQLIHHHSQLTRLQKLFGALKTKPPSSMQLADIAPFFCNSVSEQLTETASNVHKLDSWNTQEFQLNFERDNLHTEMQNKWMEACNQVPEDLLLSTANEAVLLRFIEKILTGIMEITFGTHFFTILSECSLVSVPGVTSGGRVEIALGGAKGCPIILTIEVKTERSSQHFAQVLAEAAAAHAYNFKHHVPAWVTYHVLWEQEYVTVYRVDTKPSGELCVAIISEGEYPFPSPSNSNRKTINTELKLLSDLLTRWQSLFRDLYQVLWMGAKSACEALEGKSAWRQDSGDGSSQSSSSTQKLQFLQDAAHESLQIPIAIKKYISSIEEQLKLFMPECIEDLRTSAGIDTKLSFSPKSLTKKSTRSSLTAWQKAKDIATQAVEQMSKNEYPELFSSLAVEFVNALPEDANGTRFCKDGKGVMFPTRYAPGKLKFRWGCRVYHTIIPYFEEGNEEQEEREEEPEEDLSQK